MTKSDDSDSGSSIADSDLAGKLFEKIFLFAEVVS